MNIFFIAVKDGTIKGLKTGLMLLKIMLPIYFIVVLIKYSPIMPWLQNFLNQAWDYSGCREMQSYLLSQEYLLMNTA